MTFWRETNAPHYRGHSLFSSFSPAAEWMIKLDWVGGTERDFVLSEERRSLMVLMVHNIYLFKWPVNLCSSSKSPFKDKFNINSYTIYTGAVWLHSLLPPLRTNKETMRGRGGDRKTRGKRNVNLQ